MMAENGDAGELSPLGMCCLMSVMRDSVFIEVLTALSSCGFRREEENCPRGC